MDTDTSIWSLGIGLSVIVLGFAAYALPAIVGARRGVSSQLLLLIFNLAFGWTVLGWIVALLWAVCGGTKAQEAFYRAQTAKLGL